MLEALWLPSWFKAKRKQRIEGSVAYSVVVNQSSELCSQIKTRIGN